MIINNFQESRDYPASPLKINKQKSFKAYENIKSPTGESKGMTDEQKTWLGVGLTAVASIVIGLVIWACSKGKKKTKKNIEKPKINEIEQSKKKSPEELLKEERQWSYDKLEILKPRYKTIDRMLKNGGTKNIRFSKEIMSLNKKFQPHCMDVFGLNNLIRTGNL